MVVLDMLGRPCPIPVVEAKKALRDRGAECVTVAVDNITAVENLEKMANGYGYGFASRQKNAGEFEVVITRVGEASENSERQAQAGGAAAPSGRGSGAVVVIGRDSMGAGSEELGKILIKGYIYALTQLDIPPASVIFLNSGAYLTSEGSDTADDLKKLEKTGVKILTCGTCSNYYGLTDKLAVGSIANMYDIAEAMSCASNVINI